MIESLIQQSILHKQNIKLLYKVKIFKIKNNYQFTEINLIYLYKMNINKVLY